MERAAITERIDIVELALELAKIRDPETGRQLMEVVDRILTAAGLPRT